MQTTGNKNDYYRAWAKMMVTIWQDKIAQLKVRDTGELFSSFLTEVVTQSNGDVDKIVYAYNYYGRMVDMGVGRGVTMADAGTGSGRKRKPWYNKSWYHSIKVLTEKRAELYGEDFQLIIMEALNF
jgi:hypothetical protein